MANPSTGFGFEPINNVDGSPFNSAGRLFYVPSSYGTAIGTNALVKLTGTSNAALFRGRAIGSLPEINLCAAGDATVGVTIGTLPNGQGSLKYKPASTEAGMTVMVGTGLRLRARMSGSFANTDVGQYADAVVGTVDTRTGIQQSTVDSTTIGTGTSLRILGLSDIPGNEYGTNAIVDIEIVKHQYANNAAAV